MTMIEMRMPMKAPIDERDVRRFINGIPGTSAASSHTNNEVRRIEAVVSDFCK